MTRPHPTEPVLRRRTAPRAPSRRRWGPALLAVAALVSAPGALAQRPADAVIEGSADWVARDARVGFDVSSRAAADHEIRSLEPGDYGRAAALVALGSSGSYQGRDLLIEETGAGLLPEERAAAAYGLGELGASRVGEGLEVLRRLLRDPNPVVSGAAMVALVRLGDPAARSLVAEVATSGNTDAARAAQQVLAHYVDPAGAAVPAAFERFYRLRWDAACNYGLVDGKLWSRALLEELADSPLFLEALVLRLVGELDVEGAKDHLLEILLEGEGLTRIGAAIRVMPSEVELLVESGVWRPQDRREWRWLVNTVLVEELDPFFPRALTASLQFEFPVVRVMSSGMLYNRDSRFEDILVSAFEGDDPALKAQAAYGAGAADIVDFVGRLKALMVDDDPWVAANAMGALIRMGSAQAAGVATELLATAPEDRPPLLSTFLFEVLARAAPDPDVLDFLYGIHEALEGPDRAAADSILLVNGRSVDTTALRAELPLLNPLTVQAYRGAQALGRAPGTKDLRMLARLFPREEAPDINLELAAALARNGHRAPEPLLRTAVWELPWNQSVLACGVVAKTYGMDTLINWVCDPPAGATDEDLRRVGWAIGEQGGIKALEKLQHALGTSSGAELPAIQGAVLAAFAARTR